MKADGISLPAGFSRRHQFCRLENPLSLYGSEEGVHDLGLCFPLMRGIRCFLTAARPDFHPQYIIRSDA